MGTRMVRLTVLFEPPFWIGLCEREEDGQYAVCRIVFGAEPREQEVYAFVLANWHRLRFSPALAAETTAERRVQTRAEREREQARQFQLRQTKRKEKHRGIDAPCAFRDQDREVLPMELKLGYDTPEAVWELFAEYTHMLVENDPHFQVYLDLQHYDAEVADLTRKYGMPDGRLYVAWCDGQPAGCIALRRLDGTTCELKRLYVRPAFRGRGIAGVMMQRILDDARAIGYTVMLLDTLPFLTSAIRMYRALGFYDIPPYNDSPLDTTIFLRLDL